MNRRYLSQYAALALLSTGVAAHSAEFYVDAAGAAGSEAGTQQNPFRTVQAAVNVALTGDEIRVAAGTYIGNVRVIDKSLILRGGFSRAWVRDLAVNQTTLVGLGEDAVVTLIQSDSTIDGFRITGGTGSNDLAPDGFHGGGIYSRDGSPTIQNNLIERNDVRTGEPPFEYFLGGGVYISNAQNATITNNVIRDNVAGRGAGIFLVGQQALIQGNTIERNIGVGDHGGGIFIAAVDATITRNIIRGNEVGRELSYGWGGGVIVVGGGNSAELSFNTLYENFAASYGAATFIDEGARAEIHHELIYGNLSQAGCEAVSAIAVDGGEGGGSQVTIDFCTVVSNVCETATRGNGLQVEGQSSVRVSNSIFWNNGGDDFSIDDTSTLAVTFTDSQEAFPGEGNINADPQFVNAPAADFRLAASSPCVDAADPAAPFGNEPVPNGGRADMGRFGNAADGALASVPQDDVVAPDAGGGTGNTNTGGGDTNVTTPGGNADESSDVAQPSGGDLDGESPTSESASSAPQTVEDPISGAGMCPTAAAMLLSVSMIGAVRSRRRRV